MECAISKMIIVNSIIKKKPARWFYIVYGIYYIVICMFNLMVSLEVITKKTRDLIVFLTVVD